MSRLLDLLSPEHSRDKHTVVAELIKGIISMAAPSPASGLGDGPGAGIASNKFARELASLASVAKLVGYILTDYKPPAQGPARESKPMRASGSASPLVTSPYASDAHASASPPRADAGNGGGKRVASPTVVPPGTVVRQPARRNLRWGNGKTSVSRVLVDGMRPPGLAVPPGARVMPRHNGERSELAPAFDYKGANGKHTASVGGVAQSAESPHKREDSERLPARLHSASDDARSPLGSDTLIRAKHHTAGVERDLAIKDEP